MRGLPTVSNNELRLLHNDGWVSVDLDLI